MAISETEKRLAVFCSRIVGHPTSISQIRIRKPGFEPVNFRVARDRSDPESGIGKSLPTHASLVAWSSSVSILVIGITEAATRAIQKRLCASMLAF